MNAMLPRVGALAVGAILFITGVRYARAKSAAIGEAT